MSNAMERVKSRESNRDKRLNISKVEEVTRVDVNTRMENGNVAAKRLDSTAKHPMKLDVRKSVREKESPSEYGV